MKKIIIFTLLCVLSVNAKVLVSPFDAMQYTFGKEFVISKKNIVLTKEKAKLVQQMAQEKLESKIVRIFQAKKADEVFGYGVLINKKVRSKNAAVLYMIDTAYTLKAIEIIAFNEPEEYIPSKKWNSQFKDIATSSMLQTPKDIPTITGATLSARSITNGSRVAFAIYNEILREK